MGEHPESESEWFDAEVDRDIFFVCVPLQCSKEATKQVKIPSCTMLCSDFLIVIYISHWRFPEGEYPQSSKKTDGWLVVWNIFYFPIYWE